jgi:hypothetical protein
MNRLQRLRRYEQEAEMDLIELLCWDCHRETDDWGSAYKWNSPKEVEP